MPRPADPMPVPVVALEPSRFGTIETPPVLSSGCAMTSPSPSCSGLLAAATWQPIPNCPGRYRLRPRGSAPTLTALVGAAVPIEEYRLPTARDVVLAARLADGGVISYRRSDGSCLHALNDVCGFARKLAQLGIAGDRPAA